MTIEEKIAESLPLTPEEIEQRFEKVFGREMTPSERDSFMLPPKKTSNP